MNGHPDVDDVVQETMLRAVRGIGELRDPAAFRSWLVAIAIRQVRDSYRDRLAQAPAVESPVMESAAPVPDFADQTIERLGLSGQRLQAAEATRWLDDDDRPVLALWWQEAAGELSRTDLAAGLGLTQAHAAVRVARMKERLVDVAHGGARAAPVRRCAAASPPITAGWDGQPSPLWRKRLARHVRDCEWCAAGTAEPAPGRAAARRRSRCSPCPRPWPAASSVAVSGRRPPARAGGRSRRPGIKSARARPPRPAAGEGRRLRSSRS